MKKYFYFGKAKNGSMVPIFECVAEVDPTPKETNTIYSEIVRKQGLGVPRPTHYGSLELIEIEQSDVVENKPILMHGHGNGVVD